MKKTYWLFLALLASATFVLGRSDSSTIVRAGRVGPWKRLGRKMVSISKKIDYGGVLNKSMSGAVAGIVAL